MNLQRQLHPRRHQNLNQHLPGVQHGFNLRAIASSATSKSRTMAMSSNFNPASSIIHSSVHQYHLNLTQFINPTERQDRRRVGHAPAVLWCTRQGQGVHQEPRAVVFSFMPQQSFLAASRACPRFETAHSHVQLRLYSVLQHLLDAITSNNGSCYARTTGSRKTTGRYTLSRRR